MFAVNGSDRPSFLSSQGVAPANERVDVLAAALGRDKVVMGPRILPPAAYCVGWTPGGERGHSWAFEIAGAVRSREVGAAVTVHSLGVRHC